MSKLKIDVAHGSYIIDSWDDLLSLKILVTDNNKPWLWQRLARATDRLQAKGKLDDMMWIRDTEEEVDGFTSITRQLARADATIFIPNKEV